MCRSATAPTIPHMTYQPRYLIAFGFQNGLLQRLMKILRLANATVNRRVTRVCTNAGN